MAYVYLCFNHVGILCAMRETSFPIFACSEKNIKAVGVYEMLRDSPLRENCRGYSKKGELSLFPPRGALQFSATLLLGLFKVCWSCSSIEEQLGALD